MTRWRAGGGDDVYYVDNALDVITESENGEFDTVYTTASYELSANIEDLRAQGRPAPSSFSPTCRSRATISATASTQTASPTRATRSMARAVTTSSSAMAETTRSTVEQETTSLDGGTGADRMEGGQDNDTYYVDNTGDIVVETANNGAADFVNASITYTLTANVENLGLSGGANINGTGNTLDNLIFGNGGRNTLRGGGGADSV